MATASATKPALPSFEMPSVEETTERIRELNEKLIEQSKAAGLATLEAYEKALKNLVAFEESVASATKVDWVSTLATAHTKFISDVSTSYTEATRQLLS